MPRRGPGDAERRSVDAAQRVDDELGQQACGAASPPEVVREQGGHRAWDERGLRFHLTGEQWGLGRSHRIEFGAVQHVERRGGSGRRDRADHVLVLVLRVRSGEGERRPEVRLAEPHAVRPGLPRIEVEGAVRRGLRGRDDRIPRAVDLRDEAYGQIRDGAVGRAIDDPAHDGLCREHGGKSGGPQQAPRQEPIGRSEPWWREGVEEEIGTEYVVQLRVLPISTVRGSYSS